MTRWIVWGVVILIVIAGGVLLFRPDPAVVDAATVREGTIRAFVEERARTRLPETFGITMPIDGRVLPIELEEGDRVEAGQVVARLETADLEDLVARARAEVARLEASLVEARDDRVERSALEGAETSLVSLDRTVEAAAEAVEAADARARYASTQRARIEEAFEREGASPVELDEARLAETQAQVDLQVSRLTEQAAAAVRAAAGVLPRAIRQYIDRKKLRAAVLEQELAQAQSSLQLALRDLERASIESPVDGVVLDRVVNDRRYLAAGSLLMEVGRLEDLEIEAEVLSEEAAAIAPGDAVEVFGGAVGPGAVPGRVDRIEPQAFTKVSSLGVEEQRVRVWIRLEPEAWERLRAAGRTVGADYRVRVRIVTDEAENVPTAPRSAVFRAPDGSWHAFVIRDGRAEEVPVTLGLMNDQTVEVVEGLSPGDRVIIAPEATLEHGDRVEAIAREAANGEGTRG